MIKKINKAGVDILVNESVQSNASNEIQPEREFAAMNDKKYWEEEPDKNEEDDLFPEELEPGDKKLLMAQINEYEAKLKGIQNQLDQIKKRLENENNA